MAKSQVKEGYEARESETVVLPETMKTDLKTAQSELAETCAEQLIHVQGRLDEQAGQLAADPAGLRGTVLILRVWELVTRARLQLTEQNQGLAADNLPDAPETAVNDLDSTW